MRSVYGIIASGTVSVHDEAVQIIPSTVIGPIDQIILLSDDGAETNGNEDIVTIGGTDEVVAGTGYPLRPDGTLVFNRIVHPNEGILSTLDPTTIFGIAPADKTVAISYIVMGRIISG